jgi:hypothetical protein
MTRPLANLCSVTLLIAIPLAACSTPPPPYATNVLAWPRAGESADQYQADDLACRTYMQKQATANHSPVGTSNAGAIGGGAHTPSDVAYAQCMTNYGYSVEHVNLFAPPPSYSNAYSSNDTNDAVHPDGYSYYVAYPYAVSVHHENFHSQGFPS